MAIVTEGATAAVAAPKAAAPVAAPAAPAGKDVEDAPAAKKAMAEAGLTSAQVTGTGRDGRIMKEDVAKAAAAPAAAAASTPAPAAIPRAPIPADDAAREERVKMTRLRATIAKRLKDAQNTAAMLTTYNEVDMSGVMELRNTGKDEIELVEFDYVLTLSDGARYGGRWAALRALPPNHTVTATVPAVVPLSSLRNGASGWTVTGSLGYRDPSSFARILYEAGILHYEVPISSAGTTILPLDGSPQQPPKGG